MAEFEVDLITDVTPIGENFRMFKEKLNYIPKKHMIRIIDGSNYLMHKLHIGIFNNFLNLMVLNLSNNILTELENGLLDTLVNLEIIDLSLNLIRSINDLMFVNNIKLQTINLSTNVLSTINHRAFSSLNNLCNLNLSYNQIDHIDDLCLSCTDLKIFDLSFNKINDIDLRAFYALPELTHLNLSNNQIKILPEKIFFSLKKLENLNLSNNNIENLYDLIFSKLEKLTILNLNSNSLKNLSFFLFYFNYNLADLDMFYNNSVIIEPNALFNCSNLKNLKLSTCQALNTYMLKNLNSLENFEFFSTFPVILDFNFFNNLSKTLRKLKITLHHSGFRSQNFNVFCNLEFLYIEFLEPSVELCGLNFAVQMNKLPKLKYLILKNINRLFIVSPVFERNFMTVNIEYLDLTGMKNGNIDNLIKKLRKLKYLNLSFSNILELKMNTMLYLYCLECFILKNSKITSLSFGLFKNNCKLEILDFENCPIERIEDNVFEGLVNLRFLNLKGIRLNPITESMLNGVPATTNVIRDL